MSNNNGVQMGKKLILVVFLPVFLLAFLQAGKPGGEVIGWDPGTPTAVKQVLTLGDYVYYMPLVAKNFSSSAYVWQCYPFGGTGCPYIFSSVAMVSATEGWAVGDNGAILHYIDGTWQGVNSPTTENLNSVAMVSASEGWAVGRDGVILHYTNGVWQEVSSPRDDYLYSVAMISATEGWAVGNYTILHYINGAWQDAMGGSPARSSVAMVSATEGWAVGFGGYIEHYTNGSWQQYLDFPTFLPLWSVAMVSASEGWAVGGVASYCIITTTPGRLSPAQRITTSIRCRWSRRERAGPWEGSST
jgi:hypothetical protein